MIKLKKQETFVFIGDSITHGGRLPSMDMNNIMEHGFPAQISFGQSHRKCFFPAAPAAGRHYGAWLRRTYFPFPYKKHQP